MNGNRIMRLREWPPRRIGMMWLVGAAVQLLAMWIVPPLAGFEIGSGGDSPMEHGAEPAQGDTALAAAVDTSEFYVTRTAIDPGDTIVRVQRDTTFVEFRTSGASLKAVDLSPDLKRRSATMGAAFGSAIAGLVQAIVVTLFLLLTIPLVLTAVTLTWLVQRRRERAPAV